MLVPHLLGLAHLLKPQEDLQAEGFSMQGGRGGAEGGGACVKRVLYPNEHVPRVPTMPERSDVSSFLFAGQAATYKGDARC